VESLGFGTNLALDRDEWQSLMNTVINVGVRCCCGMLLRPVPL